MVGMGQKDAYVGDEAQSKRERQEAGLDHVEEGPHIVVVHDGLGQSDVHLQKVKDGSKATGLLAHQAKLLALGDHLLALLELLSETHNLLQFLGPLGNHVDSDHLLLTFYQAHLDLGVNLGGQVLDHHVLQVPGVAGPANKVVGLHVNSEGLGLVGKLEGNVHLDKSLHDAGHRGLLANSKLGLDLLVNDMVGTVQGSLNVDGVSLAGGLEVLDHPTSAPPGGSSSPVPLLRPHRDNGAVGLDLFRWTRLAQLLASTLDLLNLGDLSHLARFHGLLLVGQELLLHDALALVGGLNPALLLDLVTDDGQLLEDSLALLAQKDLLLQALALPLGHQRAGPLPGEPFVSHLGALGLDGGWHGDDSGGPDAGGGSTLHLGASAVSDGKGGGLGHGLCWVVDNLHGGFPDSLQRKRKGEEGQDIVVLQGVDDLGKVGERLLGLNVQHQGEAEVTADVDLLPLKRRSHPDHLGVGSVGRRGGAGHVVDGGVGPHPQGHQGAGALALSVLWGPHGDGVVAVLHGDLGVQRQGDVEGSVHSRAQELASEGADHVGSDGLLVVDDGLHGQANASLGDALQVNVEGGLP